MTKYQFGQLMGTPGDLGGPISVSPAVGKRGRYMAPSSRCGRVVCEPYHCDPYM